MWTSISLFLGAFVIALFLTPIIGIIANRFNVVDIPRGRHLHDRVVPKLGGVAIFISFATVVLLTQPHSLVLWNILGASLIYLLIGVADDAYHITPWSKLLGQFAGAVLLVSGGIEIAQVGNPFTGALVSLGVISSLVTVLWIVGISNTVNISDGVDGLVSGVTVISSLILAILSYKTGHHEAAELALIFCGAVSAFWIYNFHPAKIFLGDSGSLFIGFFLATMGFVGGAKLATALLILGVPILDGGFTVLYRLIHGRPVYEGDRNHLHFRLLGYGLTQVQVAGIFYAISLTMGLVALFISGMQKVWALGLLFLIFVIGWSALWQLSKRKK